VIDTRRRGPKAAFEGKSGGIGFPLGVEETRYIRPVMKAKTD